MKMFLFFLSAIWLFALVSCIEGDEEVFLYADGSGRVKAVYRLPGMLLTEQDGESLKKSIREGVEQNENLELVTNTVVLNKGYRTITIEIKSDNVMALEIEDENSSAEEKSGQILSTIVGDINVELKGLSVALDRNVDLQPLVNKNFGEGGLSKLGSSEFRYTLHLPKAAKSSNAHEVFNEGKTLKWAYQLSDTKETPISLKIVAPVPIPWWVYMVIVIAIILPVLLILRSRVRR